MQEKPLKSFPILLAYTEHGGAIYKMHEGWVTSSVQFPNYQPKKLPGFDVLWVEITLKMRKKESTLGRRKKKYSLLVLSRIPVVLHQPGQLGLTLA